MRRKSRVETRSEDLSVVGKTAVEDAAEKIRHEWPIGRYMSRHSGRFYISMVDMTVIESTSNPSAITLIV